MTELRTRLEEDRVRGIRALLRRPLLGQRDDPDAYAAIARHQREIAEWFGDHTGQTLVVDRSGGFARLHKVATRADRTRPAMTGGTRPRPFDRRRYTLVCLALAALDQASGQTTLRTLAEAVTALAAELPDVSSLDATRQSERRAFVDALRLLIDLGVVAERDGEVDDYVSHDGDALLDVDDRRIGQLLSAPNAPSMVQGPGDLPVEVYPDTTEGRRTRARHRVMRRVLEDPVVYYADLEEAEQDWLRHSLGHVHDLVDRHVGLQVERRAEGLLAVDDAGELTDERFPDGGSTVKHAALLLAQQLTSLAATAPDHDLVVTHEEVTAIVGELVEAYADRCGWRQAYRDAAGQRSLAAEALELLAAFQLVDPVAGAWRPRPAIARFAAADPGTTGARPALTQATFDTLQAPGTLPTTRTPPTTPPMSHQQTESHT
ncbi:MAG TPA: TIGR02678 family protein [Euzebya sp.]|nr:TIGR02678 family protein [Euzebya sp.]